MRSRRRGSAMIEVGLCLALFTPLVFAAVRLAYGANQMHEAEEAVTEAARAGGACASEDVIRAVALKHLAGLAPESVVVEINRDATPARVRVSVRNYRVIRLTGSEPLSQAPSATFPYPCE